MAIFKSLVYQKVVVDSNINWEFSSSIVATPSFTLVGRFIDGQPPIKQHWINDDNWYATIFSREHHCIAFYCELS